MVLIWIKFSDIKQFFDEWSYDMQVKTIFFFVSVLICYFQIPRFKVFLLVTYSIIQNIISSEM